MEGHFFSSNLLLTPPALHFSLIFAVRRSLINCESIRSSVTNFRFFPLCASRDSCETCADHGAEERGLFS